MLQDVLRRFDDFRALAPADLVTVARHAQVLTLPGRRWLVRPGRRLSGRYYLVRGRVRTVVPAGVFGHRSARARRALYPGVDGLECVGAAHILHVDVAAVRFLLDAVEAACVLRADGAAGVEGWLERFLRSELMGCLTPAEWQRVVAGFTSVDVDAGAAVVRQGAPADAFYVLVAGTATVVQNGAPVQRIGPGGFFGEDGLILGGARNADVVMRESGTVMRMPGAQFMDLLVAKVVTFVAPDVVAPGGVVLDIGAAPAQAGAHLHVPLAQLRAQRARLPVGATLHVVGGGPAERALAAFLLAQFGLRALPLSVQ